MPRWWDWAAVAILFVLLQTTASRLATTNWTPFLFLTQTVAYIGFVVGIALGYSRFSRRVSRLLSFIYMLIMLPLQWTLIIDQSASLEEQLMSVGGRLFFSYADFFARRPVEDPIFFISLMTILFWIISASAGFNLVRNQNYLAAVLPSAIGLVIVQSYDNSVPGRIWFLAFFGFMALLLLGRLHFLENRTSWRERRVFLSPDNSVDLTSTMAIAAGLIIFISWTTPASLSSLDSAVRTWNKLTRPWHDFTEKLENAVSALDSPSGGKRGEFFGSQLILGSGFPLSDMVMFRVTVPDLPRDERPPRYYWRGRTYDYFVDGQWYITGTSLVDYSPADTIPVSANPEASSGPARFIFSTGELTYSLVYAPAQPIWLSRQGSTLNLPTDGSEEVVSWYAYPALLAGETYQVDAILNNPNTGQLSEAGTEYPAWVTDKYLQLPEDFSSKISELALEITAGLDNPFDRASAITRYLRENIEYVDAVPQAPRNQDPIEWMLFENKQGYCVYYASADVLMLRSIGIPARLAVGFAQGERSGDEFTVRRLDAHAWPEVYFPGIGWVEFEPTGNQPTLSRPLPPRDPTETNNPLNQLDALLPDDRLNFASRQITPEEEMGDVNQPQEAPALTLNRYLIPLLILFAALTIYFSWRYSVPTRIPVVLRTSFERSGAQVPGWIINWERWTGLTSIERSFESVNFALQLLKKSVPIHATPIERAKALEAILPKSQAQIETLLDEHQTSLYTSRSANASRARRAAFNIRTNALIERIRYIFEGTPVRET